MDQGPWLHGTTARMTPLDQLPRDLQRYLQRFGWSRNELEACSGSRSPRLGKGQYSMHGSLETESA
jgi:hypothetical protein